MGPWRETVNDGLRQWASGPLFRAFGLLKNIALGAKPLMMGFANGPPAHYFVVAW
jgi:hypothetical protein